MALPMTLNPLPGGHFSAAGALHFDLLLADALMPACYECCALQTLQAALAIRAWGVAGCLPLVEGSA